MNLTVALLNQAILLHRQGKITEAEVIYKKILDNNSDDFDALHMLGIIHAQRSQYEEAERLLRRAISIDRMVPQCLHSYGTVLAKLKRFDDAINNYRAAIKMIPSYAPIHADCGNALFELGHYDEALAAYDNALLIEPGLANASNGRGNALFNLKRYDEALTAFDRALVLDPNLANAWVGRGNVFAELKRYGEAIASYDKALTLKSDLANAWLGRGNVLVELKRHSGAIIAYDKALTLKPDLANAWLGRGNVFAELKRHGEATAAYDKALALKPDLATAWVGRGNVLVELRSHGRAMAAYDRALALKPDLANAWVGRGNVFAELKRHGEAMAAYDKALMLKADLASAWLGRANLFTDLKLYNEALDACNKALSLEPKLASLEGVNCRIKMQICDWKSFDAECSHLISSVRDENAAPPPFVFLGIPSSSDDQLRCAELWVAEKCPPQKPIWQGEHYKHDRIRVAYVSADFHQHATSHLMAGMFEHHDRSRFETIAISIGPEDNSEMRQRLLHSFDHFTDARTLSDVEVASRIRETEIDILVDLKGFTQDARTNIFAQRPAPIQVNYLGYPGTMGAGYIDYIIADHTVIPDKFRKCYSEKIAVLPNSYQVNDSKRKIAENTTTRQTVGLPEHGFVFCCFNNNYKVTPRIFDCWMRILGQVEDSVLWLLEDNATAKNNLRKEAVARDISSDRLIFAKRVSSADHLARHRLAGLFLDTLPFNAHTTASDALWTGLAVLTCLGETFAGRVAGSLLNAIGLPELITTTLEAYEHMAIDLATHPEKLAIIKSKLADNRLTSPLFDTRLFTRHIEAAYTEMYERHKAGLTPDHITIPKS